MSTTITLLTLPFLALISIPLVITASFTIFVSATALFVQVSVIAIELCYALITNLFTIPPSPNWSLLSFSASGINTPARRYSTDYGVLHTPLAFRSQSRSRPNLGPRTGSSNALLDSPDNHSHNYHHNQEISPYSLDNRYNHRPPSQRHNSFSFHNPGVLGLISGDEDRDFEGLGGWRCPPSYTKSLGYRSGRTTPSSSGGVSDEVDDIAWLSMNSRLELPSQPLGLRRSGSNHNLLHGYSHSHSDVSKIEPYLPRRRNSRASMSQIATGAGDFLRSMNMNVNTGKEKEARHHRRSATTGTSLHIGAGSAISNMLPMTAQAGNNDRQVHGSRHDHGQPTAMQSRGDALRSKSHTSLADWGRHQHHHHHHHNHNHHQQHHHTGSMASSLSSAAGGYFALQPMSTSPETGPKTTSNSTPNEERKPARINTTGLAQGASGGTGAGKAQYIPSLGSR